ANRPGGVGADGRRGSRLQSLEETTMIQPADLLRGSHALRENAIVIPGRGGRHWAKISTQPGRDLPMGDPAMGGHAAFALGVALARPKDKVVLFDSEGDLLTNLGVLTTVAGL